MVIDDQAKLFIELSSKQAKQEEQIKALETEVSELKDQVNANQKKTNKMYKWFNIILILGTIAWFLISELGFGNIIGFISKVEQNKEAPNQRIMDNKFGSQL